jgi:hypothetical protein
LAYLDAALARRAAGSLQGSELGFEVVQLSCPLAEPRVRRAFPDAGQDPADGFRPAGRCVAPAPGTWPAAAAGRPPRRRPDRPAGVLSDPVGTFAYAASSGNAFTFGAGGTSFGTPNPGVEPGRAFTVQGTGDQGQPLYQAYSILVDPNEPLAINASDGADPGQVRSSNRASQERARHLCRPACI